MVDTLQPVTTAHRLVIAAEVLRNDLGAAKDYPNVEMDKRRNYRLTYQLTRLVKKKDCLPHDDRADMLATGVGKFMGHLQRQLQDAAKQNKEALLMLEAEKLIEARRRMKLPLYGLEGVDDHGSRLAGFLKGGGMVASKLFPGRR